MWNWKKGSCGLFSLVLGVDAKDQFFFWFFNLDDGNWRQVQAWILLLAEAAEVNALAQEALRGFAKYLHLCCYFFRFCWVKWLKSLPLVGYHIHITGFVTVIFSQSNALYIKRIFNFQMHCTFIDLYETLESFWVHLYYSVLMANSGLSPISCSCNTPSTAVLFANTRLCTTSVNKLVQLLQQSNLHKSQPHSHVLYHKRSSFVTAAKNSKHSSELYMHVHFIQDVRANTATNSQHCLEKPTSISSTVALLWWATNSEEIFPGSVSLTCLHFSLVCLWGGGSALDLIFVSRTANRSEVVVGVVRSSWLTVWAAFSSDSILALLTVGVESLSLLCKFASMFLKLAEAFSSVRNQTCTHGGKLNESLKRTTKLCCSQIKRENGDL